MPIFIDYVPQYVTLLFYKSKIDEIVSKIARGITNLTAKFDIFCQ